MRFLCFLMSKLLSVNTNSFVWSSWQTEIIPGKEEIDPDVLHSMSSLGCFKNREKLLRNLLKQEWVLYKWLYFSTQLS